MSGPVVITLLVIAGVYVALGRRLRCRAYFVFAGAFALAAAAGALS